MKQTDKKKPVHTIPNGVWEGDRPQVSKKSGDIKGQTTDAQGNGYPVNRTESPHRS